MMKLETIRTAVLGAGRSGKAAAEFLRSRGADVCVFDSSPSVGNWGADIPLVTSATEDDGRTYAAELVVISPGIETDSSFVKAFTGTAAELIGETELACRFYNGRIIAITGTNGKTTTTELIDIVLKRSGFRSEACGNYGVPVCELLMRDDVPEILSLEVSSFQLETMRDFHPHVAVWLNFAPDHMDRYKTVAEYYQAKLHIFDNQTGDDLAVIRAGEQIPPFAARVETFTSLDEQADLVYRDGCIIEKGDVLLDLRGTHMEHAHNAENVMAALLACREEGVSLSVFRDVLRDFTPPGHRCELVRTLDGVAWYNDSKATNLHALEAALRSQTTKVVLIAGGKDKGLDYSPLKPLLGEKVRSCIVFGEIAGQLEETFSSVVPTVKCPDLESCVRKAREIASSGDAVLFSPGTSSFDMFTGYVQRGQVFRDAVLSLTPSTTNQK